MLDDVGLVILVSLLTEKAALIIIVPHQVGHRNLEQGVPLFMSTASFPHGRLEHDLPPKYRALRAGVGRP
jgi:hypothetical protein